MDTNSGLISTFEQRFSHKPTHGLFSPGRVNLIGEHIDYCGGHVLPMAINLGTSAVFAENNLSSVRVYSSRFDEEVQVAPTDILSTSDNHWRDYVVGVFRMLGYRHLGKGFDICLDDNISSGGLSSSASFTVAIAMAAYTIVNGHPLELANVGERLHFALICQRAENDFVGVSCGVMDQAAVLIGGIIKLNCSTLAHESMHQDFGLHSIVLMDTGKKRSLTDSVYNQRVGEVSEISGQLKVQFRFRDLAQLDPQMLEPAIRLLNNKVLKKRLRHIVSEEQRVLDAGEAIKNNDLRQFGRLMNESHKSLASDYEVTGEELDTITGISRDYPGVLGSRMTGAGFGGCAISLIKNENITGHNQQVARLYFDKTGLHAQFHELSVSNGTCCWLL